MYSTRTATVTVNYADTLTEGAMHSVCGYSDMICHMMYMYVCVGETHVYTWTVHAHPLCQSYYGCSNGTVIKHGNTGHGCDQCVGPVDVVSGWGVIKVVLPGLTSTHNYVSYAFHGHEQN